jgi:hypothetical protein
MRHDRASQAGQERDLLVTVVEPARPHTMWRGKTGPMRTHLHHSAMASPRNRSIWLLKWQNKANAAQSEMQVKKASAHAWSNMVLREGAVDAQVRRTHTSDLLWRPLATAV